MRPSMNAVVAGLPRSWHTAPSITAVNRGRSRSPFAARASSITSSVCTHTSPSGCHSGSCGQPTSGRSSGSTRSTTPRSSASANPIEGRAACSSSFSSSPQTRSGGRSSSGIRAAERRRVRVQRELESRRELHGAQHTQAVVAERGRIHGPQHPSRQVFTAVERILVSLGERIPGDRVDGEVAPARRVRDRHGGVALHHEAPVATAGLRLAARERHVDRFAGEPRHLVHRKAVAHRLHAPQVPQQRVQPVGGHTEHLDVHVLRGPLQEPVAHPAAHDQRAPAGRLDGPRDGRDGPGRI